MLHELEESTGKVFHFEGSDNLPLDHFAITMEGTAEEVGERAVPFRAGEEVLVTLVEPHMYNVDDAVAKIDGYIVSVAGGGPYVGQKHLVRIEEPGRTSARATMVDPPPVPKAAPRGGAVKNDAKTVRRVARAPRAAAAPKAEPAEASAVAEQAPATDANGDALESKPRRRGRRGGRRRSAAAASDSGAAPDTTTE
jgi:ribonuclease G